MFKPERSVEILADAFIQDLTRTTPGPGKHPLATGNLLDALTTKSGLHVDGYLYWIGVGDMSRLGRPGERAYAPKPIERFLKGYREGQAKARAERRATVAAERARRQKEREKIAAARAKKAHRAEQSLWYSITVRKEEAAIARLRRQLDKIGDRFDRLQSVMFNYNARIEAWEDNINIDLTRDSYQNVIERRNDIRSRVLPGIRAREKALIDVIARRQEGLMRFKQYHRGKK